MFADPFLGRSNWWIYRQQLGKSCVRTKGLVVRTSTLFLKGVRFLRGTTVWDKGESFFYPNALANKINNNGYWFFACTKQFEKGNFFIKVKVSPFFFFFCFQFKNVCALCASVACVCKWCFCLKMTDCVWQISSLFYIKWNICK